jgi:hypothetical protein
LLSPGLRLPDVRFPGAFARSNETTPEPSRFSGTKAFVIEHAMLAVTARYENNFIVFYEAELM